MSRYDLDHVGIAVRDLDRAAAAFRRLGFTLTERSYHMVPGADGTRARAGTGNHCLILRRGYVELIAPTDPDYSGRLLTDLDRYEGLHLIAFGTEFAPATARRVTRPFTERGQNFEAVFDIIELPEGAVTEAHVFAIHHVTPEVIWQPHLMVHANGALDLRAVTICAEDPAEVASRLAALFGTNELRAGEIVCLDAEGFAWRYAVAPPAMPSVGALSIGVADLDRTAAHLEAKGVKFAREASRLLVPPASACGAVIEFMA